MKAVVSEWTNMVSSVGNNKGWIEILQSHPWQKKYWLIIFFAATVLSMSYTNMLAQLVMYMSLLIKLRVYFWPTTVMAK